MKGRPNARIGFHDRWVMAFMIPALAFVIPIVFFGVRFREPVNYTWQIYVDTLLITLAIWIGNRYIMIWARNKYPDFLLVRKRLMIQSLVMLVFTLIVTNALSIILKDFCGHSTMHLTAPSISDMLISANSFNIQHAHHNSYL